MVAGIVCVCMFGPRSGTMVPDKKPRKWMGGGFRSHSPPRSSLSAQGVGISPRTRNEDDANTPLSVNSKRPNRPASSKEKLILAQEQEAAEIEREYIKNLQQQVYYLELELQYNKEKGEKQQKQQKEGGEEEGGGASVRFSNDGRPSTPAGGGGGGGGESFRADKDIAGTPYAAVAAVREAAERACAELQRTRVQQMEDAASRAYEITAQHLEGYTKRLEVCTLQDFLYSVNNATVEYDTKR